MPVITSLQAEQTPHTASMGTGPLDLIMGPVTGMRWVIDRLKHLDVSDKDECPDGRIDLQALASKSYASLALFHTKILKKGSEWSETAEKGVDWLVHKILFPLSCCSIGRCAVDNVSKALAYLTRVVVFTAFQVLHIIPYVTAAAIAGGSVLLFYSSPAALITCFIGTILIIQVLVIYQIMQTVRWTNWYSEQVATTTWAAMKYPVAALKLARKYPLVAFGVGVVASYAYSKLYPEEGIVVVAVESLAHRVYLWGSGQPASAFKTAATDNKLDEETIKLARNIITWMREHKG